MKNSHVTLREFALTLYHQVAAATPQIIVGIITFFAIWLVAYILRGFIGRIYKKRRHSSRHYLFQLLGKTAYVGIILLGLVTALGTMGINVTALVTGLGLTGFAVGFALKDALSNVLAGFIILFYEPFRIGDHISVSTAEGEVSAINLRYTTLQTDGKRAVIPNATILTNVVTVTNPVQP